MRKGNAGANTSRGVVRIVHYSLIKPFNSKMKCPNGMCDQKKVYDLEKQKTCLNTAKTKWKGYFAQEWNRSLKPKGRSKNIRRCNWSVILTSSQWPW